MELDGLRKVVKKTVGDGGGCPKVQANRGIWYESLQRWLNRNPGLGARMEVKYRKWVQYPSPSFLSRAIRVGPTGISDSLSTREALHYLTRFVTIRERTVSLARFLYHLI
jgi:hypothetical protein